MWHLGIDGMTVRTKVRRLACPLTRTRRYHCHGRTGTTMMSAYMALGLQHERPSVWPNAGPATDAGANPVTPASERSRESLAFEASTQ